LQNIILPFYILFPLVGIAVKLTHIEAVSPKDVTYIFLSAHCNEFVLGFAVVGMLAALMSSGDSFLNIINQGVCGTFSVLFKVF